MIDSYSSKEIVEFPPLPADINHQLLMEINTVLRQIKYLTPANILSAMGGQEGRMNKCLPKLQ